MSLKIKTHKFESRVAPAAQRRPIARRAESKKSEAYVRNVEVLTFTIWK